MAAHNTRNIDDFNLDLRQVKRMIARKTTDNTMPDFDSKGDELLAFAKFVSKYDESFYELNRLIGIAVTLPAVAQPGFGGGGTGGLGNGSPPAGSRAEPLVSGSGAQPPESS